MTDIRVTWDPLELVGDWVLFGSVLDTRRELASAVAVAIMTDGLAFEDDIIPDGTNDRRGVWSDHEADEIHQAWGSGSRLWLLSREKQTERTRARAEQYISDAVRPFVTYGIADDFAVRAYWFRHEALGCEVDLFRKRGGNVLLRYEPLWREIEKDGY